LVGQGEGGCQLRPSIESIGALAGLDLGKLVDDCNALGFGKTGHPKGVQTANHRLQFARSTGISKPYQVFVPSLVL
jgi:hypothetical protein